MVYAAVGAAACTLPALMDAFGGLPSRRCHFVLMGTRTRVGTCPQHQGPGLQLSELDCHLYQQSFLSYQTLLLH